MVIVLAAVCSTAVGPEEPGGVEKNVTVRGRLTDEGIECPALRSDDGTLYTLVGDLKGAKQGDRVLVEGTVAEISTCMQGITLEVRKIEKIR